MARDENARMEICSEPLIMPIGGSCYLKVPTSVKQQYPQWKAQNPSAAIIRKDDCVQLVYEWRTENDKIITTNEE